VLINLRLVTIKFVTLSHVTQTFTQPVSNVTFLVININVIHQT